jgi:polyvinyl alcohol dehydrogenase (cytochrome)
MTLAAGIGAPALADDWPMANHDPRGSRNQETETTITAANVAQLAPRWVLNASGNVYATPLVVAGAVYVPDQGGKMWKVDANTGAVLWSTSISDYNGRPNTFSRTSPAYADGMVFVADNSGAHLIAIDADTGALRWITQLDSHVAAQLTGNPTIVGDRLYMGVSSMEQTLAAQPDYPCCTFRGSLVAVDIHSGQIVWRTYTMPDNGGTPGGFSGGAVVSTPAVDVARGLLFIGTDHQYTQPDSVVACLKAAPDDWSPSCYPPDARFDSFLALDLNTGEARWTFFGAGADTWQIACGQLPRFWVQPPQNIGGMAVRLCPPVGDIFNWAFAGGNPQLFQITVDGAQHSLVGIGQKSGVYWAFDADTGDIVWHTLIGPYSEPGGLTWGGAYDGKRIYVTLTNIENVPFALRNGQLTAGGAWTALDPTTGAIMWQTADPQQAADYADPTVANGVVYVGSLERTRDQMFALNAANGEILWRFGAGGSVAAHPAVADGAVYWGSGFTTFWNGTANNKLYAFSLSGR